MFRWRRCFSFPASCYASPSTINFLLSACGDDDIFDKMMTMSTTTMMMTNMTRMAKMMMMIMTPPLPSTIVHQQRTSCAVCPQREKRKSKNRFYCRLQTTRVVCVVCPEKEKESLRIDVTASYKQQEISFFGAVM